MRTTIVLAEDHPVVRHVLRAVLATEPGFNVIGETGDGQEALALVERLQPRVLLLDLALPGLHGLEVARQLTQRAPTTRILVFSLHTNEAYILEARRAGAAGYIGKDASAAELLRAVYEVAAGRDYYPIQASAATAQYSLTPMTMIKGRNSGPAQQG